MFVQAYGAGNYPRMGILLQRGLVVGAVWYVVAAALWLNAERILLL